ncbi:hypothetical protein ACFU6S_42390 [Streptomyces sp. NPDC057456]|uniref:hypothetical protein n=1 Tax=Streptomyces sp. NPDC057456 TaxID=3346139 RepID=UPI0036860719
MKITARHIAASVVLASSVLGTLALPAQADGMKADTGTSVSEPRNNEFPTDIFGVEDSGDFIQGYYEYKKGCTNDCEPGLVRGLVHKVADRV